MRKVWEIDNHNFPIVWVLFSNRIPILWYTSAYGKCMGFPYTYTYGKCNETHGMGNVWEIDTQTFPIVWVLFFPSDSHPLVYFSIWEMHGFPHKFPRVQENATKPVVWGKSGKSIMILFP